MENRNIENNVNNNQNLQDFELENQVDFEQKNYNTEQKNQNLEKQSQYNEQKSLNNEQNLQIAELENQANFDKMSYNVKKENYYAEQNSYSAEQNSVEQKNHGNERKYQSNMERKNQIGIERKKNKQKIKEYKKQLKSEAFDLDNELIFNDEGDALIECKIGKAENIFNQYDLAKQRTITDEFEKYLMDEVEIIPMSENVAIKMYVDENFTAENENQVKKALKNHFGFKITTDKVKIKRNDFLAGMLIFLGLICLFLSPFVYRWFENSYFPAYESTLIMTWFFLWEGTGIAFLDRGEINSHQFNMLRLYNAKVSFVRVKSTQDSGQKSSENQSNLSNNAEQKLEKKSIFKFFKWRK